MSGTNSFCGFNRDCKDIKKKDLCTITYTDKVLSGPPNIKYGTCKWDDKTDMCYGGCTKVDTTGGRRKVRSNKGKKRGAYGPRTGKTRSGKRFRTVTKTRKVGRKTRSNKGKKRTPYGPRTGKTRSGRKFRGVADRNFYWKI